MLDKNKLYNDLTFMHIMLLYDFMQPIDYMADITAKSIEGRKDAAIRRYRNDRLFHARVDEIVSYTMQLIEDSEDLNT